MTLSKTKPESASGSAPLGVRALQHMLADTRDVPTLPQQVPLAFRQNWRDAGRISRRRRCSCMSQAHRSAWRKHISTRVFP
ncbi:MAG: hypothetical protein CBHOC_2910 [uncultured Caballeronia sp.]|nr:MAG: hypothetical protein CBHOC_2910 [uncultured Caballeronia sp.]